MKLYDYQQKQVEETIELLKSKDKLVLQLSTGGGKCLGYNTPILMFDGSIKMVQDIKTGDKLMGDDSIERNVQNNSC